MTSTLLSGGTVHTLPSDIEAILHRDNDLVKMWRDITPLARNEWICLVISAKRPETRTRRLERMRSQLSLGQRRPCCWQGCPHREKSAR